MYQIDIQNQTKISGKGGQLVRISQAEIPTPEFALFGFHIFEDAVFIQEIQTVKEVGGSLSEMSTQLQEILMSAYQRVDLSIVEDWLAHFDSDTLFAIRSSASLEDSHQHSFAGQFETCLDISLENISSAILKVLLSLYSERVLAYCHDHQIDWVDLSLVVIIQRMVTSRIAGIYFTANPKGLLNQQIIVVGSGRGDQVVEDQIETTMYSLFPDDDLFSLVRSGNSPVLETDQIDQLTQYSHKLQSIFGPYLDIEFAFDDDNLYILQCRPITSIKHSNLIVLDNSNIVESYPGLTQPLTYSFIQEAYEGIFRSLAQRLVGSGSKALNHYQNHFTNMLALYQGRVYYQIHNWLDLLQLLPFSSKIIPIWQDMLGVRNLDISLKKPPLSIYQRLKVMINILKELIFIPQKMIQLQNDFNNFEASFRSQFHQLKSIKDLIQFYYDLKDRVLLKWDLTFINDLYAFIATGILKQMTKSDEIQDSIAGIERISSMEPAIALGKLTKMLKSDSVLQQKIVKMNDNQWLEYLNLANDEFSQRVTDFIDKYGDRAPEELKLETETFRTHPVNLLMILKQELHLDSRVPSSQPEFSLDIQQSKQTNPLISWIQTKAIKGIAHRETSRLNRTRLYGMTRAIFRKIGQVLYEGSYIDRVEDVFYLSIPEIIQLNEHIEHSKLENIKMVQTLISDRRQEMATQKNIPAYSRLIFSGSIFSDLSTQESGQIEPTHSGSHLQAIGCSAGQVEGQVIVVTDVSQVQPSQVKDKIIITKMTDPGWVYLLTQAKGIIAEKGSLLSHTAIISRELGIPSIVNLPQATQLFINQEWIYMNGQTGQIRRMEASDADRDKSR